LKFCDSYATLNAPVLLPGVGRQLFWGRSSRWAGEWLSEFFADGTQEGAVTRRAVACLMSLPVTRRLFQLAQASVSNRSPAATTLPAVSQNDAFSREAGVSIGGHLNFRFRELIQ
jgi:hypothetical protein